MILTYNSNTYLYCKFIQNILTNYFGEFTVKKLFLSFINMPSNLTKKSRVGCFSYVDYPLALNSCFPAILKIYSDALKQYRCTPSHT